MNLFKIEFHKFFYSRTFWVIIGLYLLLLLPSGYMLERLFSPQAMRMEDPAQAAMASAMLNSFSVFGYPSIWQNIAYYFGWFHFFLAIILVSMVSNEFSYRTFRQNVIDGMSKRQLILAKQGLILMLSVFATLVVVVEVLYYGQIKNGNYFYDGAVVIIPYFLSVYFYLNFALLITMLIKKSGLSLGLLLLYSLGENIVSMWLNEDVAKLLPMNAIDELIPNPLEKLFGSGQLVAANFTAFAMLAIYALICGVLSWYLLKRGTVGK